MAVSATLAPEIYIGGQRWTTTANQAEFGVDIATLDVTTFDYAAGGFTNSVAGLKTLAFNTTNFQDYADGALDTWLRSNYGTQRVVSIAYVGAATGNGAAIGYGLLGGYRPFNAAVGAVPTTVGTVDSGTFAEGQVSLISTTSLTATTSSTPVQIGAISATQQVVAAIHVLSASGTTPTLTCRIQSASTSGGSYTNRSASGTALSAPGDQWLTTGTGTAVTDTWWKLSLTITGTTPVFSAFATLAIV
jgi:hypothetical protein